MAAGRGGGGETVTPVMPLLRRVFRRLLSRGPGLAGRYLSFVIGLGLVVWLAFSNSGWFGLAVVAGVVAFVVANWRWLSMKEHLTGVTAVGTCVLGLVALLQWNTLEKTDQTLRIGQRPWIGIELIDYTYNIKVRKWSTRGNDKVVFELTFYLTNVGNSPAHVLVSPRAMVQTGQWQEPQTKQCNTALDEIRKGNSKQWREKYTVLPGDVFPYFVEPELARSEIKGKEYTPMIVGCIFYRSALDKTLHKTPFVGLISAEDPDAPKERGKITPIKISDHAAAGTLRLFVQDVSLAGDAD